jgi:hypothetical protein
MFLQIPTITHRGRSERGSASGSEGRWGAKDEGRMNEAAGAAPKGRFPGLRLGCGLWRDSCAQALFASMSIRSALPSIFRQRFFLARRSPWPQSESRTSVICSHALVHLQSAEYLATPRSAQLPCHRYSNLHYQGAQLIGALQSSRSAALQSSSAAPGTPVLILSW